MPAHRSTEALERELAQLRSEVRVLQAALAFVAAETARLTPTPYAALSAFAARMLGFAEAASRHLGRLGARTTRSVDEMVGWAELLLRAPRPRP